MSTPEGVVKERVKKLLKQHGAYWHMPVGNGLGAPSLDFICCVKGLYFGIETKAGNKLPTPRQSMTMNQIREAGGVTFLVNDDAATLEALKVWLTWVTNADFPRQTSDSASG